MSYVVEIGRVHVPVGRSRFSRVKIDLHELILKLVKIDPLIVCFIYLFLHFSHLAVTIVLLHVLLVLLIFISYNIFEEAFIIILSLLHVLAKHVLRQTLIITVLLTVVVIVIDDVVSQPWSRLQRFVLSWPAILAVHTLYVGHKRARIR